MSKPRSKFSGFLTAAQSSDSDTAGSPITDAERPAGTSRPSPSEPSTRIAGRSLGPTASEVSVSAAPIVAPRRGRPPGKRSDPEFDQVTAYIRRRTHQDVKIALLQEGSGREFSELVEELLANWLRSNT